jgi:outer membrane protein assembly factor BamD (BamD/ComL family)
MSVRQILEYKVMRKNGLILFAVLGLGVICAAETWHLGNDQNWQKTSENGQSAFMLAASDAKQYVSTGNTGKAKKAYDQLKKNYPEIASEDFNAYVKAEILYSRHKYFEAANAYDKFLEDYPKSPFFNSALERQQQISTAYLNGQKRPVLKVFRVSAYEEGTDIANKIADRAGDAPAAKRALETLAQTNEKRGAYEEAYKAWSSIATRWPTGEMGQESLIGRARSLERAYKGPKFDGKVLESSRSYYSEYIKRYPDSAQQLGLEGKLPELDEKLSEKELLIANYYAKTGSYTAADIYYQRIINDWPACAATKTAEEKQPGIKKELEKQAQQQTTKKKKINWKGLLL